MKKFLLPFIAVVIFTSCAKENVNRTGNICWKCTYATTNGINYPDVIICNNGEDPKPVNVDANGNDLGYICNKR